MSIYIYIEREREREREKERERELGNSTKHSIQTKACKKSSYLSSNMIEIDTYIRKVYGEI